MKYPIILDLETKHTFREFSDHKKLGISVVGIYDFKDRKLKAFFEQELHKLFPILEHASIIIGFNNNSFDLPVLQGYYPGDIAQFASFDILEDIRLKLGRRLALNDLISATLGKKKSGHGLGAIDMYKEKRFDDLKKYCLDDVALTCELFEYGVKEGVVHYMDVKGKMPLKVQWRRYMENSPSKPISLTLPF